MSDEWLDTPLTWRRVIPAIALILAVIFMFYMDIAIVAYVLLDCAGIYGAFWLINRFFGSQQTS